MSQLKAQQQAEEKRKAQLEAALEQQAQELNGKAVTVYAKAGSKGKLYGSITSNDIASALKQAYSIDLDKRKIELSEPLNELGAYEVIVKLAKNYMPKLKVIVAPREEG
jgi:large subunit ribosomal protein L9